MRNRIVSGIFLMLLLTSMLTFHFKVRPVQSSGIIYIRADGSIDPPTAPIQRDGDIYTFSDNVFDSIVIERGNIVVDGSGYRVQGAGSGDGFYLSGINNVTIHNTTISGFHEGLFLNSSSYNTISGNIITNNEDCGLLLFRSSENNTICGNDITNNSLNFFSSHSHNNTISENIIANSTGCGMFLDGTSNNVISRNKIEGRRTALGFFLAWCSNNIISGNKITNTQQGIRLLQSSGSELYHNSFINNTYQVYLQELKSSYNSWDNGYPSGGNYWSDYKERYPNATAIGDSGIWDTPYAINENNTDRYPLVNPGALTNVTAFYTLDSFFLGNMTGLVPPNQYFAKGDDIDRVKFSIYINGSEQVYTDTSPNGEGWYSSEEYDMADVTSNLTITAYNGADVWVQETVETNVFETAFWLREVINLALETECAEIITDPGSGFGNVWRLSATFQWPEDPFEGEVDLSSLPLIGGKYGVSAGFGFGLSLASDKTITAEGSGKFKVTIADYEAGADIGAEATIKIGDSIELEDFVINVHGNIKIPIKQKYKWDVWRFSIGVEVGIDFEADASFSFHIEEATSDGTFCDGFDWVRTANDIRFTVRPYAAAGVGVGELRVEGEGTVTFTVHVPEPYFTYPDDLKVEATIKLILKTFLHSWEWTVLKYSSGSPVEWTVNASGHGWINRTWATGDYAQYAWMENTTAGNYLENVYLYANPSVASSSETVMMIWTHDDLSKPYIQGFEVYYSLWNSETEVWSLLSPVTNNTIPEDDVSIKFDALGNAVAVWSQINNASLSESVDPFSLFNQTEVAYAVWNHTIGLWSEPVLITNNYAYDYSPLLISDQDGNLMLNWLVDQDCNFSTFNDLCIYSSTWNGEQWSSPAFVANPGLISSPIHAAYHHGEAAVVWSEHTDGNTTTLNDTELFYSQFSNYSWSSPIQLTMNNLEDAEPSIAFRHNRPIFVWIQRNETDSLMFFDPENGSPRSVLERARA